VALTRKQLGRAVWTCVLTAGLILILTAAFETRACADTLDVMVVTSAGADLATTEWALQNPGLREGNPLLQGTGIRVGVKTLTTAAVVVGARHLERRGHSKAAKVIKVLAVVVWSGAAVQNAIRARGARP
jgi:hypothetical protein